MKGMIKQLFTLAGIVAGYVLAIKFFESAAKQLASPGSGISKIVCFLLIFIVCIIAASIAGSFAGRVFKIAGLGWINRFGGILLGFLKGSLIVMIISVILVAFLPADSSLIHNSVTLPYIAFGIKITDKAIPRDIRKKYKEKLEEIKPHWLKK
jgi:membrane protein required for colicin V production